MLLKAFGTVISVCRPEFRGGRFSEVGNVIYGIFNRDLKLCPL